jgi:hypothetical protein
MVMDPVPAFAHNPLGIRSASYTKFLKPADIEGLNIVTIRYLDSKKEDDMYMYIPGMRRVRRMSVGQKQDSAGGTDHTWDDYRGWDGRIFRNTYKFLGTKELLLPRHNEFEKMSKKYGEMFPQGMRRERVKTYIIEAINKDPNYMYSKRILTIDPEHFGAMDCEMYDRHGKLWKKMDNTLAFKEGAVVNVGYTIEIIRLHTSPWIHYYSSNPYDKRYKPEMFTVEYLQRGH